MRKELFNDLIESIKEGGAILRGEEKPVRVFTFPADDVKKIREKFGLSQQKFAELFGISIATLKNWEQGRRKPSGSATVLLRVLQKNPEAVFNSLR
jgi:putative transcriptional regulator